MRIRPLRQNDGAYLCSIFKDNAQYYEIFFDSCNSISEWDARVQYFLNQNVVSHFIMEEDSKKIGWISYMDVGSAREVGILVISKEYLRCGYGSKSLSWLIAKSKEDHKDCLLLNVNQSNTRAIHFYKRFGFEIVGEEIIPECNEAIDLAQYKMSLSLV